MRFQPSREQRHEQKMSPLYGAQDQPCCPNLIRLRCGETRGGVAGLSLHILNASQNHTIEFQKLATCLGTKGNQILQNLKTIWISMLGSTKRVLEEYKTLITKMAIDSNKEPTTKKNLKVHLEWVVMLALPSMMPLLHAVNSLIEFAQSPACYIVDFVSIVN